MISISKSGFVRKLIRNYWMYHEFKTITFTVYNFCEFSLSFHCCFLLNITMICSIGNIFRVLFNTKCLGIISNLQKEKYCWIVVLSLKCEVCSCSCKVLSPVSICLLPSQNPHGTSHSTESLCSLRYASFPVSQLLW